MGLQIIANNMDYNVDFKLKKKRCNGMKLLSWNETSKDNTAMKVTSLFQDIH